MVRAPFCVEHGMAISPLQRLVEAANTDPRIFFVMLVDNYRSHPDIVHVVNVQYNDKLIACTPKPVLPNAPAAVFLSHSSPESREADSPSWMNYHEAHMVVHAALDLVRVQKVAPKDIAVLSPYRKQVQKIAQIFYFEAKNDTALQMTDGKGKMACAIQVRTVEMFQGRESPVVLLSTVRNRPTDDEIRTDRRFGIGFLKQPQRSNVAVSRAQHVMMIFGNADLLRLDPLWAAYVERIRASGGVWQAADGQAAPWVPSDHPRRELLEDNANEAERLNAVHEDLPFRREH